MPFCLSPGKTHAGQSQVSRGQKGPGGYINLASYRSKLLRPNNLLAREAISAFSRLRVGGFPD